MRSYLQFMTRQLCCSHASRIEKERETPICHLYSLSLARSVFAPRHFIISRGPALHLVKHSCRNTRFIVYTYAHSHTTLDGTYIITNCCIMLPRSSFFTCFFFHVYKKFEREKCCWICFTIVSFSFSLFTQLLIKLCAFFISRFAECLIAMHLLFWYHSKIKYSELSCLTKLSVFKLYYNNHLNKHLVHLTYH